MNIKTFPLKDFTFTRIGPIFCRYREQIRWLKKKKKEQRLRGWSHTAHHVVLRSSSVHIKALEQRRRNCHCFALSISGHTDSLAEVAPCQHPVALPKRRVTFVQQITHQLHEEALIGWRQEEQNQHRPMERRRDINIHKLESGLQFTAAHYSTLLVIPGLVRRLVNFL